MGRHEPRWTIVIPDSYDERLAICHAEGDQQDPSSSCGGAARRDRSAVCRNCERLCRTAAAVILVMVSGCSLTSDTSSYGRWTYDRFNDHSTFQNKPICDLNPPRIGMKSDRGKCGLPDPALSAKEGKPADRLPRTVASSIIPWYVDPSCRSRFPTSTTGDAPTRRDILVDCFNEGKVDTSLISVSISGGGSKSAVFATEALFSLDAWGILDQVDVISSVSGGSFAAALYGLSCDIEGKMSFCDSSAAGKQLIEWPSVHRDESGRKAIDEDVYEDIAERVETDLVFAQLLDRYNLIDRIHRAITHRSAAHVLAENYVANLLEFSFSPRLQDLNPRRPNIVLNATNVSTDRRFLEQEAGIPRVDRRLRHRNEMSHFAFTDYYFERLLRSDLAEYPVGLGVAGSAAFPAVIDYLVVGRFLDSAERLSKMPGTSEKGIDFIHLLDGGVHENHGLTEVKIALEEIFRLKSRVGLNTASSEEEKTHGGEPERVVSFVVDSSTVDVNGVSQRDPAARGIDATLSPFRFLVTVQAVDTLLGTNAAQHLDRFEDTIEQINNGCQAGMSCDTIARSKHIGITTIDGYDEVILGDIFHRCEKHRSEDWLTYEEAKDQVQRCDVMRTLKSSVKEIRSYRKRNSWADLHPQCYFEVTRQTPTSYDIDEDMAICLRHAARWAVAIRMTELCRDEELRGGGTMFPGRSTDEVGSVPADFVGLDCSSAGIVEALATLPALPRCPYEKLMNGWYDEDGEKLTNPRTWLDIPRPRAHCECSRPYGCEPEGLFSQSTGE